jgi:3-hydroxyacyl-CoA dehydrogenase
LKQPDGKIKFIVFLFYGQHKYHSYIGAGTKVWSFIGVYRKGLDEVIINQNRRVSEAKRSVIEISDSGYVQPVQRKDIKVLGRSALGALYAGIHGMRQANYATDHDSVVAKKLAYVMCGGDLSEPQLVSEQYLLDLEREAFLSLCGEKKSLERIQSVLKSGKPVRN